MKSGLGFVSATGIAAAIALLAIVFAWTLVAGPVLFSPGALNAHAKAGTTLGGVSTHAQLTAECDACHTAPWSARTMSEQCIACHTDVRDQVQSASGLHGILLAKLAAPTCRGCHTEHRGPDGVITSANPATFPHDLTGYSLRAHRRMADGSAFTCGDCHGDEVGRFDQAACATCHRGIDTAFMTQHERDFGADCLACHKGSDPFGDFNHSFFPLDHGDEEQKATCKTCHPGNRFAEYSCYGCHEHTRDRVAREHEGRPLSQLADCVKCHPGGREAEEEED